MSLGGDTEDECKINVVVDDDDDDDDDECHTVLAHNFNPSSWELEADRFLSSRPYWSTEFQGSQGYSEKCCLKNKIKNKKRMKLR